MKIYIPFIACLLLSLGAAAQTDTGETLAQRQALRMKDSLILDIPQYRQVLFANRWLNQQKQWARQLHPHPDSLTSALQRVENKRDSMYQAVLPANKYELYKQRKITLISNQ